MIQNHPFVEGNKRVGHAAMEVVMVLNGIELFVDVDEAETLVLDVAQGVVDCDGLTRWLHSRGRCRRSQLLRRVRGPALGMAPLQGSSTSRPRGVRRTRSVRPWPSTSRRSTPS